MPDRPAPAMLEINAYDGAHLAPSALGENWRHWSADHPPPETPVYLRARRSPPGNDWRDERVGWGLVLPYNASGPLSELEMARDAPEPIQALLRSRSTLACPAPVLRCIADPGHIGFLRRGESDLPVAQSDYGIGKGAVPRYLLIYARPDEIPWEVQYSLQSSRFVGRLCLEGRALENYVTALLNDWGDAGREVDPHAALVWSADHRNGDITTLMRQSIAEPLAERLRKDDDIRNVTRFIDGSSEAATAAALAGALAETHPCFIVTTSHGMTGPLDRVEEMAGQLGFPVDSENGLVTPDALLRNWQPDGAIWYAHACCGAGSNERTLFKGLLEPGSDVDLLLQGIARCGTRVAPLPQALLGTQRPLRAFIGHVEPTFNWTLQQADTGQFITGPLLTGLYDKLFQPEPVGMALAPLYGQLGSLYTDYDLFRQIGERHFQMLYRTLVARDIQSTVILGDPTVVPPV